MPEPYSSSTLTPSELYRLAELGKISGGFLHDMVNHVTAVTLSMNYLEERATRDSELLRHHAEQTARMRKSMEDFAKGVRTYMKHGAVHCFFKPLGEIRLATELFRYKAHMHGITIEITGDASIRIYGNRLKFGQIISNLVSNAIDAYESCGAQRSAQTPARPQRLITVDCRRSGTNIQIQVVDNGAGIPPKVAKELFRPFVSTKKARGTGLGLVSVKKIVEENFGGRIEISSSTTSTPGTTCTILFPARVGGTTRLLKTSSK